MDVRLAALKCLIKILEYNKFFDEVFNSCAEKVKSPSELKFILSGAVKYKITLDYYINRVSSRKVKKLSPVVRNILRLGVYELEFLKKPEYAAVNSYVELCAKQDKKSISFVNAVLRSFLRKKNSFAINEKELGTIGFISVKYSHPEWLVEKWLKTYGREQTEKICDYNNRPASTSLRINTLKTNLDSLLKTFSESNINFKRSRYSKNCIIVSEAGNVRNIPGYCEGQWVVQGESSSLVSEILAPQPGEKILDFCAAPGAKTTHIAALMKDQGKVLAIDISPERIKRISENCSRLGIKSVETITGDAAGLEFEEKFDRVLVDAPCSNTGVFAARPDARWRKTPEDINTLSELQMKILKNAAKQLKPGGILVYSTCSIEPEENEELINSFLRENKKFKPEKFKLDNVFGNEEFPGMLQILQSKQDIDGFFIAKLLKCSE